jgi:hypothetical protein
VSIMLTFLHRYLLLYLADRLVRRARIHLLLALCLSRVFLPFACSPQGEQLGLPPAVPPPIGWSTGFMATPRTCRVQACCYFVSVN